MGDSAVRREERRAELRRRYAGLDENHEARPELPAASIEPPEGTPGGPRVEHREARGESVASVTLTRGEPPLRDTVSIGDGVALELVRIPAAEPIWVATCEITNAQYALFDPSHDSGVEPRHSYQFGIAGYPVNRPRQPVVRIPCDEARAFCRWLVERTGRPFRLPTELEWEHACRAGTTTPFSFGDLDTDFSPFANFADAKLSDFVQETYIRLHVVENPTPYDDWIPKDPRFDDGGFLSEDVGGYAPNAWDLHDMHGNVAEWTTTVCPWDERQVVVRGGSWYDRPKRGTSSFRLAYRPYQKVFNVGFRVVCDEE